MNWFPHIWYVLTLLIVAGLSYLHSRSQQRSSQSAIDAYDRLLARRDQEYVDLADRSFAMKNLPPSGVDLAEVFEERREEVRERKNIERKNGGPIIATSRHGPVDKAQLEMAMRRRKEQIAANQ